MNIVQKGNKNTNSSNRDGHVPFVIVDHISAGSMSSLDAWFTSPSNRVSSAHFGVSKTGEIHQFVAIDRMAWANGLTAEAIPKAAAPIIRQNAPVNPNKYTVSIEHEGTDGELTEAQFAATVWLHKYIQDEIKRRYGRKIEFNKQHVIGHFQVDPIRKPLCPGPKFPWERLYKALLEPESEQAQGAPTSSTKQKEGITLSSENAAIATKLDILEDEARKTDERLNKLEDRLKRLETQLAKWQTTIQTFDERVLQLEKMTEASSVPEWAQEAFSYYAAFIHEPSGSTDFWRLLTIMYRAQRAKPGEPSPHKEVKA